MVAVVVSPTSAIYSPAWQEPGPILDPELVWGRYTSPPWAVAGSDPKWLMDDDSSYVDVTIWDAHGHNGVTGHFLEAARPLSNFSLAYTDPDTFVDTGSVVIRCAYVGLPTNVSWGLVDTDTHEVVAFGAVRPCSTTPTDIAVPLLFSSGDPSYSYLNGSLAISVFSNTLPLTDTSSILRVYGVTIGLIVPDPEPGGWVVGEHLVSF